MLVVDASLAFAECVSGAAFESYEDELVAPPLLWAETRSALHEAAYRGEVPLAVATEANVRLARVPVKARAPRDVGELAWRIADDLGWAKTYDAEYLALAGILSCRLVTLDARLRKGADRLGYVVSPAEL